ncbi:hypothetical protein FOZ63_018963, partial [Perkinsus olseni]
VTGDGPLYLQLNILVLLDLTLNTFVLYQDCSFLGKPTIYRCEALGVEYAYELKDWTSHTWTTGRRSPHASCELLRQPKRFRFRQCELLRQQQMIRLLLTLLL